MAHHKSALKRIKLSEKARRVNRHYSGMMESAIKDVLESKDKKTAEPKLKGTVSILDRMALKNMIHKNKAANQKSRLARFVTGLK